MEEIKLLRLALGDLIADRGDLPEKIDMEQSDRKKEGAYEITPRANSSAFDDYRGRPG